MSTHSCSGVAAAESAGTGDHRECKDCHLFFPSGGMYCHADGVVCEGCHQEREAKAVPVIPADYPSLFGALLGLCQSRHLCSERHFSNRIADIERVYETIKHRPTCKPSL